MNHLHKIIFVFGFFLIMMPESYLSAQSTDNDDFSWIAKELNTLQAASKIAIKDCNMNIHFGGTSGNVQISLNHEFSLSEINKISYIPNSKYYLLIFEVVSSGSKQSHKLELNTSDKKLVETIVDKLKKGVKSCKERSQSK